MQIIMRRSLVAAGQYPLKRKSPAMRLDYLAHSCFLLEQDGFRLLFDPYDPSIGYKAPKLYSVDLIVVSHEHDDHNAVNQVNGPAQVVRGVARRNFGPLTIDGEVGWHGTGDSADPVSLTLVEWSGRRLAHFGDLGCPLDTDQQTVFENLDLLLIPCGGGYTIDGREAAEVVRRLQPRVAIPMHYQTPFLNRDKFPNFQTAEPFLEACSRFARVETVRSGSTDLEQLWDRPQSDDAITVLNLQHQMA